MPLMSAKIVAVDPKSKLCTVETENGLGKIYNVVLGQSYANAGRGAGQHVAPKVGTACTVALPDDKSRPRVISYHMPKGAAEDHGGGTYPPLYDGDQATTSDENGFIVLRDSGILEIGATPLANVMCFPLDNLVRHTFDNLEWLSPVGTMKWKEKDGKTAMAWMFNEQSGGKSGQSSVVIRAGAVSESNHVAGSDFQNGGMLLELTVDPGGAGRVWGFYIDGDGYKSEYVNSDGYLEIKKSWEHKIGDKYSLSVGTGGMEVMSNGDIKFTSDSAQIYLKSATAKIEASTIEMVGQVTMGRNSLMASAPVKLDKLVEILTPLIMAATIPVPVKTNLLQSLMSAGASDVKVS